MRVVPGNNLLRLVEAVSDEVTQGRLPEWKIFLLVQLLKLSLLNETAPVSWLSLLLPIASPYSHKIMNWDM